MAKLRYKKLSLTTVHHLDQILDAINTSSYKLAKFLVTVLSPLAINEYTVNDSFAFAKEITNCNYLMAILDVESLFTNIPLEETIENCVNDLFFDKYKIDNLTKQDVHDLLSAAGKRIVYLFIFFFFYKSLYRQINGVCNGVLFRLNSSK